MRRVISLLAAVVLMACNLLSGAGGILPEGNVQPAAGVPPTLTGGEPGRPLPTGTLGPVPAASTSLNVPLRVENPDGAERKDAPVTAGVPLPQSLGLKDGSRLRLVDAGGKPVPLQVTALGRWGGAPGDAGAPIRWALLDFQATLPAGGGAVYYLQEGGPGPAALEGLRVVEDAGGVTVESGSRRFTIRKEDGGLVLPGAAGAVTGQALDAEGKVVAGGGGTKLRIANNGNMRVSVEVHGSYPAGQGTRLEHTTRYWFYAGQPVVRIFHTLENNTPCPLDADGQIHCYEIGSEGSIRLRDYSLVLPTGLASGAAFTAGGEGGTLKGKVDNDVVIFQGSSGTANWNFYPTMKDWDGNLLDARPRLQAYATLKGYETRQGGKVLDAGSQAPGWLDVQGWGVGVTDFWQNFPKALRARPDGRLEVGLFPDEYGPADFTYTLRPGEHKTHEVWLSSAGSFSARLKPLFAQAPVEWYISSGGFGFLAPRNPQHWPDYEQYIDYQLVTSPEKEGGEEYYGNLPEAIAGKDFYGIFDYGDWPMDYEGFEVSPLNPKYHNDYGMWLQWARSANPVWFELALAADRHFADLDVLHTLHTPRHWSDGIVFGHSYHDEAGFTNPHRNLGGNHPDTMYLLPGLLLTYYLTGYEKAWQSALEVADCIDFRLRNDTHLCESLSPGDCSGEGWALGEGLGGVDARPAANSLLILAWAGRATGDSRYLQTADALVGWAAAAKQPFTRGLDGSDGSDGSARPWVINLYLRSLAEYLEVKNEYGLPDSAGGRQTYLGLADWLVRYAWMDLPAIDTGARGAYPYEWFMDGRKNIEGEENDNTDVSINNWLLLGADALAYAHRLKGDGGYLEKAQRLFRTGSRDPWYPDDQNFYSESKQTVNSIVFGQLFLSENQRSGG